jgi:hypothetical protein
VTVASAINATPTPLRTSNLRRSETDAAGGRASAEAESAGRNIDAR